LPTCPSGWAKLTTDEATANVHADDPIAIGGRTSPREDVAEILGGKLDALPMGVRETTLPGLTLLDLALSRPLITRCHRLARLEFHAGS